MASKFYLFVLSWVGIANTGVSEVERVTVFGARSDRFSEQRADFIEISAEQIAAIGCAVSKEIPLPSEKLI
ncbi:MAG: hypothetical protein HRU19_27525 [Pseudobacteriovorax sp.]|nr:hypothetical protein [Pseudobacteriovorax sp.]